MRYYPLTEKKRERWIKEGRGTGTGADYNSWLKYEDFASKGDMSRFIEGRHERRCVTFSKTEHRLSLYLDASRRSANLYDQFLLDLDTTRAIAEQLCVKHPKVTDTNIDLTMTTDWVVERTPDCVLIPFSCKYSKDLSDFNQAEHTEIERRYWELRGQKLAMFTEDPRWLSEIAFLNLKLLHACRFLHKRGDTGTRPLQERLLVARSAVLACGTDIKLVEFAKDLSLHLGEDMTIWQDTILHLIYRHDVEAKVLTVPLRQHSVGLMAQMTLALAKKGAQHD